MNEETTVYFVLIKLEAENLEARIKADGPAIQRALSGFATHGMQFVTPGRKSGEFSVLLETNRRSRELFDALVGSPAVLSNRDEFIAFAVDRPFMAQGLGNAYRWLWDHLKEDQTPR